jgi:hypothetical protein
MLHTDVRTDLACPLCSLCKIWENQEITQVPQVVTVGQATIYEGTLQFHSSFCNNDT